ncbi:methionine biosynthesis protein MetW [Terrihabitans rhizophilus]|uniref:Methionine biosynthesis protein MetW n=1 Tax=Terrihabitans rhizophilus TaxID=3092662 RepID=A0ABU4RPJ3_9HYPH|nr:methionine biosynthesis protein MetW [Terrihabitans sp. PJ23]MDX6806765.1 methionine biosynthesis protein MetW [Terrihabitans sp. PJ23]
MSPSKREGAPLATGPAHRGFATDIRPDHLLISEMVSEGSRVLDVGSGDGQLLRLLIDRKNVDGRGIELSRAGVNASVAHGLSVIEGDADTDLADYPTDSFDYVILSQTLQATRHPKQVMEHLLRIGRHAIVSVPNFGHWRMRMQLVIWGRMPVTPSLPASWYDTTNIHLCTIRDFVDLCDETGAQMVRAVALDSSGGPVRVNAPWWFWNLFGAQAIFLLRRRGS